MHQNKCINSLCLCRDNYSNESLAQVKIIRLCIGKCCTRSLLFSLDLGFPKCLELCIICRNLIPYRTLSNATSSMILFSLSMSIIGTFIFCFLQATQILNAPHDANFLCPKAELLVIYFLGLKEENWQEYLFRKI